MGDTARNQLRILATGALYLVSTAALLRAIGVFIDNPMTSAVIGAAAVSLIAARVEVPGERFVARARKRMAWGAAIALGATVVGVLVVLATGGSLAMSGLSAAAFFGIAEAVGIGYSAEMLLRGIPLTYAKRAGIPDGYAFTFAAMAGVAAIVLEPNVKPIGLVLTAASGAAFTALWIRGGDGHAPITAHILWVWLTDAALSGELFQLTEPSGSLTSGHRAAGLAAIGAAVAFAGVTVALLTNRIPFWRLEARDFPGVGEPSPGRTDKPKRKRASASRPKKRKSKS